MDYDISCQPCFGCGKIGDPGRPYATAEKLAELGLTAMAMRLGGNETRADIMADVSQMSA